MAKTDHLKQILELKTYYITFCFCFFFAKAYLKRSDISTISVSASACGWAHRRWVASSQRIVSLSRSEHEICLTGCSVELRQGHPYPGDACGLGSARARLLWRWQRKPHCGEGRGQYGAQGLEKGVLSVGCWESLQTFR